MPNQVDASRYESCAGRQFTVHTGSRPQHAERLNSGALSPCYYLQELKVRDRAASYRSLATPLCVSGRKLGHTTPLKKRPEGECVKTVLKVEQKPRPCSGALFSMGFRLLAVTSGQPVDSSPRLDE